MLAGPFIPILLFVSCSGGAGPGEPWTDSTGAATASDEALQVSYDQEISFGEGAKYMTNGAETDTYTTDVFECGHCEVPSGCDGPDGETAQIAVL